MEGCLDSLHERPAVETEISAQYDLADMLGIIGSEHHKWLVRLWSRQSIKQEPLKAMLEAWERLASAASKTTGGTRR